MHGGKLYKGRHPAMVSMEEFNQVQQIIRRQIGKPHYGKHTFAYRGLVKCARCGRAISADRHSGHLNRGDWVYYHCNNIDGKCNKKGIREDFLEEQIDDCLRRITIVPEVTAIIQEALEQWITREFRSQETCYHQLLRSRFDNERLLNELVEMRMRQLIEDDRYRAKQHELQVSQNSIGKEIAKQEERMAHTRQVVSNAIEFRLRAREEFLKGDTARRREIAKSLGVRYLFNEGCVYIEVNPLLAYMQRENTPKVEEFEPPKIRSHNTKRTDFAMSVPLGWGLI
ncbi:MAG: recombinase zinc beta ribbon domain-containing protein, partial [Chthonomonadales bacterium]